ncbi:TetR/AcrR family transcriptional regulator [Persicimonas caeni]|uniref:TetR/AcrR family transcriptional regulator n=1 Tax=Persicimonas caeni TaxID=2292766 RepID=A0A4Y6PRP0_PERCE|nr:TetR/AcrR family transcriptional regulator [Persicimonas caeni]QDG50455.1 TetR/AcrR family transcriptional regulator [Persicimonas caeni]QED31676.1 TetR/AcrR family transcriptional regulator [Persicimonas caeni]
MAEETTDTRTRIFQAADELFCQYGYDGVSIRDVARHAGVNKASVFYYFSSKEELFEAVLNTYWDLHREWLSDALDMKGGARERMHRLIDNYWSFMQENARYSRLIQGILASDNERREAIKRTFAPIYNWTIEALSELSPEKGPRAARQLYLTFVGAVVNYFTYAPALEPGWQGDPMGPESFEERRQHLHWLLDLVLDDLLEES